MNIAQLFDRYRELQNYVGWSEEDTARIRPLTALLESRFPELVDDFYEEIKRHPQALKVITGGTPQIERLKGTLINWLRELLSGPYDSAYVARRWQVGYKHVEIGLDQVYTNVALSRLRQGLLTIVEEVWPGQRHELHQTRNSLNMLLDLDLAIIEDAYQAEHLNQQQQAERLAAIGQVAGGIAHELRNPMNVIKTSAYYLLHARNPSPEKVQEHLQRIEHQVTRADGVITALSNFARLPIPNLQPFDVEQFVQQAVKDVEFPPEIEVRIECPQNMLKAIADVNQLQIVLSNLLRTARDAMPEGGQVTIRTSATDGQVTISVIDTGSGIQPEFLHRVMQPLFTTKARGIGLGLAMGKAIVEKCDGTLSVDSTPGAGATFSVRLCAASDAAAGEQ